MPTVYFPKIKAYIYVISIHIHRYKYACKLSCLVVNCMDMNHA